MANIDAILLKVDKLISISRLQEITYIMSTNMADRIMTMAKALQQLRAGAYLLGTGPFTLGIIPLTVDEVLLGRLATILEQPTDTVIDYSIADTSYFVPREVSRVHAKIVRRRVSGDKSEYSVVDMGSTCGTFVNGTRVDADQESPQLSHGDIISLGSSQINTYVFYVVEDKSSL